MTLTRRLRLGDELAALRNAAALQAKDLAAALGWDASKVSKLERGKQLASDGDLVACACGRRRGPARVDARVAPGTAHPDRSLP
ncbi:helix-turn-helix domain-containing protein [Actinophytocola xanthii]|nr:helix-turn-helix domain-containing protein [Actinophytocola xanthii]